MKKFLFLFLVAVFFISSCKGKQEDSPVIGLSLPTQREERWVRDKEAMILESERLNVTLKITVSDNDAALQISQCEELISMGIDILILAPHDARSAATIVDMAHKKDIPVISYDRLILNAPVDLYISFNNREVGRIQAGYLVNIVPEGNYVVLSGSPTDNNSKMFNNGALDILEPLVRSGHIEILMNESINDWQPAEAYRMTIDAYERFTDIDAILAPNDGTARGVIQALEEMGVSGTIPVTGQDGEISAARLIVEGKQGMTIFKDTRLLAEKAIEISLLMIEGKEVTHNDIFTNNGEIDVPSLLLDPISVDINNLDEVLIDSGYILKEDVYGK